MKRKGRPPYRITEKDRRCVEAMAAHGTTGAEIAQVLGISERTVRRHYQEELATAAIRAITQVAQALFKQAISGNVPAGIFIMKARAGWSDRPDLMLNQDNREPIQIIFERGDEPERIRVQRGAGDSGSASDGTAAGSLAVVGLRSLPG